MASGDTWFVNPALGTVTHETNGVIGDLLEASGWKAFPTQAAAQAFARENPAQRIATEATTPAQNLGNAALNSLGLPKFRNTRDFASRLIRVVAGLALLLAGLNMIVKDTTGINVAKDIGKGAAIGAVA
jgi:hypothetical protein